MQDIDTDVLVITCIDKRFRFLYDNAIAKLQINEPYVLALPGSALMTRENRDELKRTIQMLSSTLTKVVAIDHADCAAYTATYGRNDESLHAVVQDNFILEILAINKELGLDIKVDVYFMFADGELFGPSDVVMDWKFK